MADSWLQIMLKWISNKHHFVVRMRGRHGKAQPLTVSRMVAGSLI